MKKRWIGMILAICMVLALFAGIAPTTAVAETPETYALSHVQGGAILHCFNWSYDNIREALPDIAKAGYTAVQTSPVQPPKDYAAQWTDSAGQWWKLYQPLGIRIAGENESWLGTAEELTALCTAADIYDIKVIVDIVVNHLANDTTGGTFAHLSPAVDSDMQVEAYYHDEADGIDYGANSDRYNITHRHMGMPDLNTGHHDVQDKVYALLKACVACGVDGFRFDAAKHIETPNDADGTKSDFWDDTVKKIKTEYPNLFIYGEILGPVGTDPANYTAYMAITDNETGNNARNYAISKNAGGLAIGNYAKGSEPKNYVLWAESHDTYMDGSTKGVSDAAIVNTWAIVGARADSTALYLARPNADMGEASTDTTWNSKAVAEVNKFKNYFDGKSEYLGFDQDAKVTYIERGSNGVVISKLDGGGSVSLVAHQMANGTYKDQVGDTTFTVANGIISGTVGSSGVAVVYNTGEGYTAEEYTVTIPSPLYLKLGHDDWKVAGGRYAIYLFGGTQSSEKWVDMTAVNDTLYRTDIPSGDWTKLIFCRMNGSTTENNWDNRWNQTVDLTAPSVSSGYNCFTVSNQSGDKYDGSWSQYSTGTPGYYLVGNMNDWAINSQYKMHPIYCDTTEELACEVELKANDQFKVVYSADGHTITKYYPDGADNYGQNTNDNNHVITENGTYTVYFRPKYDGNSDWYANCMFVEKEYAVNVATDIEHGTVSVDKRMAAKDQIVTISCTPDANYVLSSVTVKRVDNNVSIATTKNGDGTYSFSMVRGTDVTVSATFTNIEDGFYLIGLNGWTIDSINQAHKFKINPEADDEYIL